MSLDQELRDLERAVQEGVPGAKAKLAKLQRRLGVPSRLWAGAKKLYKKAQSAAIDDAYFAHFLNAYRSVAIELDREIDGELDAELSTSAHREMSEDCRDFVQSNLKDLSRATRLGLSAGRAGTDFFLTRNRHGAGFWDEGLGAIGERLTRNAHAYGDFNLYQGDDGLLYGRG